MAKGGRGRGYRWWGRGRSGTDPLPLTGERERVHVQCWRDRSLFRDPRRPNLERSWIGREEWDEAWAWHLRLPAPGTAKVRTMRVSGRHRTRRTAQNGAGGPWRAKKRQEVHGWVDAAAGSLTDAHYGINQYVSCDAWQTERDRERRKGTGGTCVTIFSFFLSPPWQSEIVACGRESRVVTDWFTAPNHQHQHSTQSAASNSHNGRDPFRALKESRSERGWRACA